MRVIRASLRYPIRNRADLQALLDGLTQLNRHYIATRGAPPLYTSGVRYARESRVAGKVREDWYTIPDVLRRRSGDCEDLAAWRAAEIGGRAVPVRSSVGWHILVLRPDGRVEDPSRALGMR